ncbi:protein translocase subunit secE/sec61 gamma [Oceanospirillum multiglobuliferum]|uniref:Protein translocase subunit SecE n=1 Tax=Oceanospirillum multiglobuliferum TaxID=64969 RepID=A0A1T4RLS1_9GAMM|nr:preprotein translocase subunit SecE [Oceanospirillum multiglobuliferum]OPX54716.1 preprotein translocase subunit SecE [Oceanospirillum multiglobuliferum]SKA16912.1 protein translocase subunit secE/sec61 gamma [Oceanospirillum multiglobuliferum]
MKSNAEAHTSNSNGLKWAVVVLLVSTAVAGNLYFSELPLLYRTIAVVVLGVMAALVALKTDKGRRFADMAIESRVEIRKVVWPTKQETIQTTMIVLAAVLLMGLVLWGVDSLLSWLISLIIA